MAFQKEQHKIVTLTIEENGDLTFLATDSADVFLEQGETITRRASHVEPVQFWQRVAFHCLRWFGNKNSIAAWTRTWRCDWRVNTKPVGGPVLTWFDVYSKEQKQAMAREQAIDEIIGNPVVSNLKQVATWRNRQDAIGAEVKFLNNWFAERSI